MIKTKALKSMVFHLNKVLKEICIITLFIFFGIALFVLSLELKFIASDIKITIAYIIANTIVIILYLKFLKYIKQYSIIDQKYLSPRPISWNTKILIIILGYYFSEILNTIFSSSNKSCNQTNLEKDEVNLYTSLWQSGLTAPIIEEIIFRGILFLIILTASSFYFKRSGKRHDVLGISAFFIFSSILFGYAHIAKCTDIENIGGYLSSGIVLSLVYIISRDIKLSIILHMLMNIISILNRYEYHNVTSLLGTIIGIILIISIIRMFTSKKLKTAKVFNDYVEYYGYRIDKYLAKRNLKKRSKH